MGAAGQGRRCLRAGQPWPRLTSCSSSRACELQPHAIALSLLNPAGAGAAETVVEARVLIETAPVRKRAELVARTVPS